jgi:hypothetical protein
MGAAAIPHYVTPDVNLQRFADAMRQNMQAVDGGDNPAIRLKTYNDLVTRVDRLYRQQSDLLKTQAGIGSRALRPFQISGTTAVTGKVDSLYIKEDGDAQVLNLPDPILGAHIVCIQNGTANRFLVTANASHKIWDPDDHTVTPVAGYTITLATARCAIALYGLADSWAAWTLYGTTSYAP